MSWQTPKGTLCWQDHGNTVWDLETDYFVTRSHSAPIWHLQLKSCSYLFQPGEVCKVRINTEKMRSSHDTGTERAFDYNHEALGRNKDMHI